MITQENVGADGLQSSLHRVAIVTIYLVLNMSMNLLNTYITSRTGFAFPLAISIAHLSFSLIALLPMMSSAQYRASHNETLRMNMHGLLIIGVSFGVNIAFNNMSLTLISLSLNQMIRASIPLVTAACSVFIDRTIPTRREIIALVAISVGICAVLAEDVHANSMGVTLCIVSTVLNGLMMSMIGFVLNEKFDVWRLSFYQAPIALVTLLPIFIYREIGPMLAYITTQPDAFNTVALILLTCIIALAYNAVHATAIALTSATTTTVIGQGKIFLILVLSAILLRERDFVHGRACLGGAVDFSGIVMYS